MKTTLPLRLLPFVLLLLAPVFAWAQGDVRITLLRPPPNQLRVADLWRADVANTTNQTYEVYLHGWATEANTSGLIVDATSTTFRLRPGERRRLLGSELEPIEVKEWNAKYKAVLLRTGLMPPGEYTVCVEVVMVSNDSILGTDCFDQPVDIERLSPPILVNPADEAEVAEKLPAFNWLAPAPLRSGDAVTYEIKIVEILGRQTAFDAMSSNPAFFTRRDISENAMRYPIGARSFVENRRYAWQIKAFLVQRFGDRIDVGESEIWWFEYKPTAPEEDDVPDIGRRTPVIGGDITPRREPPGEEETEMTQEQLRSLTTVVKDASIRPGFMPPNVELKDYAIAAKDVLKISPMVLRALLHQCQGGD